jgi:phosphopantetheinyl transferase
MAYRLLLTVRPAPSAEDIPVLRELLEKSFPRKENTPYFNALLGSPDRPALPRVAAQRLGALSLLPSLLTAAEIATEPLILRRDRYGRPYCETPDGPVSFDFNLSHAAAHIAGALLVGGGRVGVDVEEPIPPKRALPLIHRFCTEGELALLGNLPHDEELAARFFTSTWVEREALAKQDGGGMPLRFDTTHIPAGLTVWTGYLPETETRIALCGPIRNAPDRPRLLPDSLPVLWA